MSSSVYVSNDHSNSAEKAYWVYKNLERALNRGNGRLRGASVRHPLLSPHRETHPGTLYESLRPVVALGVDAHLRLGNVVKTTVLYINPRCRSDEPSDPFDLQTSSRAEAHSRLVTLGRRARAFSKLFWSEKALNLEIPPIGVDGEKQKVVRNPRVAIFNHSNDQILGQSVLTSALRNEGILVDCYGFDQAIESNRVRCRDDSDIPDAADHVHVHVGRHSLQSERFRICDSWQTGIPTVFLDRPTPGNGQHTQIGLRPDHDVLLCHSPEDVESSIDLIVRNPALGRIVAENGRAAAAACSPSWEDLAREVAP